MAAVLGALMAVDFGGPINKAAYLFGTVALAGGQEEFMAAVMAGGMVPPLGVALAGTLFPEHFTTKERHTAMTDYLMGACFITEGVVPFVLRDRCMPFPPAWWVHPWRRRCPCCLVVPYRPRTAACSCCR